MSDSSEALVLYDKYRGTVQRCLSFVGEEEATRIALGGYVKVISVSLGEDGEEPSFEVEVVHEAQATDACSRVGRYHAITAIDDLGDWLKVDLAAGLGPAAGPIQRAAVEACVARHIDMLRRTVQTCAFKHADSERPLGPRPRGHPARPHAPGEWHWRAAARRAAHCGVG